MGEVSLTEGKTKFPFLKPLKGGSIVIQALTFHFSIVGVQNLLCFSCLSLNSVWCIGEYWGDDTECASASLLNSLVSLLSVSRVILSQWRRPLESAVKLAIPWQLMYKFTVT